MSSSASVVDGRLTCDRRSRLSSDAQIVWNALVKKNEQRVSVQAMSYKSGRTRHNGNIGGHSSVTYRSFLEI